MFPIRLNSEPASLWNSTTCPGARGALNLFSDCNPPPPPSMRNGGAHAAAQAAMHSPSLSFLGPALGWCRCTWRQDGGRHLWPLPGNICLPGHATHSGILETEVLALVHSNGDWQQLPKTMQGKGSRPPRRRSTSPTAGSLPPPQSGCPWDTLHCRSIC